MRWTGEALVEHKNLLAGDLLDGEKVERCVLCGALTLERKDAAIVNRRCYVPCVGQLCEDCCWETYGTTDLRTRFN